MNPRQIRAGGSALFDQGIWAYGVPSCRKLYVVAGMLRLVQGDAVRRPSGCIVQVDAARLFLKAREHGGERDFYLNLSAADLESGYP